MDNVCPVCKSEGVRVENITVKHIVNDELLVNDETYHLCMDENCDVVYFDSKNGAYFDKQQVKVPIWFKKDVNPKYICYCNKVTEGQIIDAVTKQGAKSLKDVVRLTGAMKNGRCEINNPLGKCCSPIILETIKKALDSKLRKL